jgi:hypothetical protein
MPAVHCTNMLAMLYILSQCMLPQWHIITCFYTIHIHIVFKIYKIVRSNINTNRVMLILFPAHITTHKTDIYWPQLADFLRLKQLELVSWDVRPCSLTARSLDDPSNHTAGHHHIPADCNVTAHYYDNRKLSFLHPSSHKIYEPTLLHQQLGHCG